PSLPQTPLTPQSSTLFPYTTLFRSVQCLTICTFRTTGSASLKQSSKLLKGRTAAHRTYSAAVHTDSIAFFQQSLFPIVESIKSLDRKSTHLNSSHVSISYAVFC